MRISDWSSDVCSSDLPLWDSAVKTQELASDIGGNNGRNGADLGKLAASLMLPADGARVMMVETGGWDTHSGQRNRLAAQLRGLDQLIGALQAGLGPDRKGPRLNSSH